MNVSKKKSLALLMSGALSIMAFSDVSFSSEKCISAYAVSKEDEVLNFAGSKLGMGGPYNEASAFYGFYGVDVPWCAMFVYYCAASCGVPYAVPKSSYCDEQYGYSGGVQFFKKLNEWEYSYSHGGSYHPKRGDVVYFDWDHDGFADHVGYIDGSDNSRIYTIEGNSGDMVKKNSYSLYDNRILGYGRPNYTSADPDTSDSAVSSAIPTVSVSNVIVTETTATAAPITTETTTTTITTTTTTTATEAETTVTTEETTVTITEAAVTTETFTSEFIPIVSTEISVSFDDILTIPTENIQQIDSTNEEYIEYYVTSPIGAWFRSAPEFYDDNRICILDTGTILRVYNIDNNWAEASFTMDGGYSYIYGYIHTSTINYTYDVETWGSDSDNISYGTLYQVTSPIGCWMRNTPEIADGNQIELLDTWQTFEVISIDENGWMYSKADLYGNITYGYIYYENAEML